MIKIRDPDIIYTTDFEIILVEFLSVSVQY